MPNYSFTLFCTTWTELNTDICEQIATNDTSRTLHLALGQGTGQPFPSCPDEFANL